MKNEQLIPRKVLFADPDKTNVQLSPDGQFLSYLAPYKDNLNLWIAPLEDIAQAKPVSASEQSLRDYWWLPSGDWLIYSHDNAGDENWQLYGYQLSTGETWTYTEQGCQARLLQMNKAHPETILIALNERDRRYHDVYTLNIKTGEKQKVFENNQYWDIIADNDFRCRVGINIHPHIGEYVDLETGVSIADIPQHDLFGLYFYPKLKAAFSNDNKTLYIAQTHASNTSTLVAMDMATKQSLDIANHPQADICDILYHPQTKTPIAYAVNYERKRWFALNAEMGALLTALEKNQDAEVDILGQSEGGYFWLISFVYSHKPREYYRYDPRTQQLMLLFKSYDDIEQYSFNSMKPVNIEMRDGVQCLSYLSLPTSKLPVPLVMIIHGGPNYRDYWGFNAFHQWLTNRGYAVLSVNFRGSTGFGRAHSEAGNGEWAGKIREDLIDAANWAIKAGITSEKKVALFGRSFGGYQVLAGLTFTPEKYACGVDIVGPANLDTMMKCFPPYWASMRGVLNDVVGADPTTEEGKEFLKAQSPLTYANHIKRPLLIGHGMNDPRISQAESDQMVAAMQTNKVPVAYAVFPNEGHQISHPANRMAFYGLVEAFLAKNLGGKAEPYNEALPDTMRMVVDDFGLV